MSAAQAVLVLRPAYQGLLSVAGVALENAMACRVFRAVVRGCAGADGAGAGAGAGAGVFSTVVSGCGASESEGEEGARKERGAERV